MFPKNAQIAMLEAKLQKCERVTSNAQETCDKAVMDAQAAEAARVSACQEAQSQTSVLGDLNEALVKECKVCVPLLNLPLPPVEGARD